MGVRILKPKPHPPGKPHRDPGDTLDIRNYSEVEDGAGAVERSSLVALSMTDTHTELAVRLAVRIFRNQEVVSLQFWRRGWHEMVPKHRDNAVAVDAEAAKPAGTGHWWRGFTVPANMLPRDFVATYTQFRLSNAHAAAQAITWRACYEGYDFFGPHVKGHSHLQPHPHKRAASPKKKRKRR